MRLQKKLGERMSDQALKIGMERVFTIGLHSVRLPIL